MPFFNIPKHKTNSQSELHLFGTETLDIANYQTKRILISEWAPQSGIQLTWPHAETDWAYMLEDITACYIRLAYEIAIRERLLIVSPEVKVVQQLLEEQLPQRAINNICYCQCPTNDTWARDHGFLSIAEGKNIYLADFRFNGWGGKFDAEKDNEINVHLFQANNMNGIYTNYLDFELEGGSIESDGMGTILTTATCLLNPNRNGGSTKAQIEQELASRLGANHFLWLYHGTLAGDDTDGHIDTLARLCPNQQIAYVQCIDQTDEHYSSLTKMEEEIRNFRTQNGQPYSLIPLPLPSPIFDEQGKRLPATYANFLFLNNAILLPIYNQKEQDTLAHDALAKAFPDREIIDIDCSALIRQHGSLHCATMQFPKGVLL